MLLFKLRDIWSFILLAWSPFPHYDHEVLRFLKGQKKLNSIHVGWVSYAEKVLMFYNIKLVHPTKLLSLEPKTVC